MTKATNSSSGEDGDSTGSPGLRRSVRKRRPAKNQRLRRRSEFDRVYDAGAALRSEFVVLIYAPNLDAGLRSAVVASRKVGPATVRNRAKRLLREAIRQLAARSDRCSIDAVLVARRGLDLRRGQQVIDEVGKLLGRAGILTGDAA